MHAAMSGSGISRQWALEMIAMGFRARSRSVQVAGTLVAGCCQASKRQLWHAARELIVPKVQSSERSELTK